MPVTNITYQPEGSSLNSAYSPVVVRCRASIPNATNQNYICPVVYCDVYIENVYYKTLSRTQYIKNDGTAPEYEFDIKDAIQELMNYNLPAMRGIAIETMNNTIKRVFVRFRNAFRDNNGFVKSEQLEPVQGTSTSVPIAGGGNNSNEFYVLNGAIQHEEDDNFEQLLRSYSTGVYTSAWPLTKRPQEYKICKSDSSHFPIVSAIKPTIICVRAKLKDGQIIDLCSDIMENCPVITNITYTVIDNGNGTQTFTFNWTLPGNLSGITGLNIYSTEDPANGWLYEPGSINAPRSITLPLGVFYFRFGLVGSCLSGDTANLPGLDNIGLTINPNNNPPSGILRWNDNQGNEDRTCMQSVCTFVIQVIATDPDNDISTTQILRSMDNGASWQVYIANLSGSTFNDSINAIGIQKYKAVILDSMGNTGVSNVLTYSKQQSLNPLYRKTITGITCLNTGGDGPTNYDVFCTGSNDFSLSDPNLMNTSIGFIRMKVDAGTPEMGLSKAGGGALLIDEVLPVTKILTASYAAVGQNPQSAYPYGYPSNLQPVFYTFEYSLNGTSGWTSFQLSIDD